MKKHILLFFILICSVLQAQTITIESLRKEYYKLNTDSAACAKLFAKVSKANPSDNLISGYKGAITASMANFAKNKTEKIQLFNSGKKLLEQSIAADTGNVELRFLRFTIQSNCPKALGYHRQLDPDKKYILAHLNSVKNSVIKSRMEEYLLSSSLVSEDEKKKINGTKK